MSAAHAATQVRRPPSAPVARTVAPAAVAVAAVGFDDHEDEFRLNLSDIPRMRESLEVEGLKPSLLSRLLDLIMPIKP